LVIPCVNRDREKQVQGLVESLEVKLPVTLVRGRSREVMAASDVVLLASGTATLEAMLLKKPMVVGYRLSNFSYKLLSHLIKVPWVALPNLLAQQALVPELLQDDATPEALGAAVLERLDDGPARASLKHAFSQLHESLRQNADERAATAVSELLERQRGWPRKICRRSSALIGGRCGRPWLRWAEARWWVPWSLRPSFCTRIDRLTAWQIPRS